ncbi:MAG: cell division protein ZapA [Acidobacteria bacterium]|nr:cell division protein ZapA [Acidobacteriota bacterium]
MRGERNTPIEVEIGGQVYRIQGVGSKRYLMELASYVDRKIQEIAEATQAVDSVKLAVLAALNIADEYFRMKKDYQLLCRKALDKLERMENLLAEVGKE